MVHETHVCITSVSYLSTQIAGVVHHLASPPLPEERPQAEPGIMWRCVIDERKQSA